MAIAGSLIVTVSARTTDFENGMRKTTATLKLTEQQAKAVTQAFAGLGNSFSATATKAQQTSTSLTSLTRSLTGLAAGVVSIQALTSALISSVQAAMKLDALTLGLKAITGSSQGAADAINFLRATGDRLGVQFDTIAGSYKTLLAATQGTNLGLKETQTVFLGIVEASRAMGLSAEDTAGALRPLTQIIGQQAFQADELRNELGARLPVALQLLVKASNGAFTSVKDLFDAMEAGKLKGQVALDLVANFGVVLRQQFAPAAQEAANSAAAAFERFKQAVTDLQVALGRELLPALGDVARAMTEMLKSAQGTSSAFGSSFTTVIREAGSAVVGLAGGIGVLAKAMALLNTRLDDPQAIIANWNALKEAFLDVATAQHQILNPAQLTRLNPKLPALPGEAGALRPIVPGGGEDGKAAKKTAAEKESERIAERQKDLVNDIANAYDAANLALEYGVELERTRMEQKLREANFSKADLDTLMATYDATQRLLEQRKQDVKLAEDRKQLSTELQESLDKQLYTERELLQHKLTALGFSKEEAAIKLKMYDTEKRLREEAEKRKEAAQEAAQATKEHLATMERLQEKLQPRKRQTRAEELQGVMSEMAEETSDPYTLAKADIQREDTLREERWDKITESLERMAESAANIFTEMAKTGEINFKKIGKQFGDMLLDTVADAIDLKGMFSGLLKDLLGKPGSGGQAGTGLFGSLGGLFGSGGGGTGMGVNAAGAATSGTLPTTWGAYESMSAAGMFGGGLAAGGPVMPGKFYTVGERGPETLVAGGTGQVIPHGGGGQVNVTFNVSTPDVGGFRASERQLWAAAMRQGQQARRVL